MKLTDVVDRINGNVDRFTTDLEYYIGGEHFESNELEITQKGLLKENLGKLGFKFHFAFQDRDVIFMARNPHLRKAGMVRFSGLCSDASYILRSKDESVISQEYLAILLQSDHFWGYCESHKVGSVNFANNWSSIANYEFELPSAEQQKKVSDKVWAAYRLKESYKKLLAATEEMVKSQFIEMFDSANKVSINAMVETVWGSSPDSSTYNEKGEGVPFYQGKTEFGNLYINPPVTYCTAPVKMAKKNSILMSVRAPVGAVNIATQDCCIGRGLASITPKEGLSTTMFVYYALKYMEEEIERLGTGSTFKAINKDSYAKIQMPQTDLDNQNKFVTVAEQADKSGFVGSKSQFIEMFGNPVTNDKEWSTMPISEVAPESPSDDKQTGEVWLLNLDMIESNTGKVINKVMEQESNLLSVSPFDEDNVLFSKLRPYLNKVVIPDGKGYATTELIPLRPNPKLLNNVFFSHLLRSEVFVKYANSISTGTKMPRMPIGDLRKFRCILPPLSLQEQFVSIAEQADKSGKCYEYRLAS